ncbi:ricin-type beta-trefoil lectin domain protein [Nocardia sp. Marseille-Q1738]
MTGEIQVISAVDGRALDTRHAIRLWARVQIFDRNNPPNRNQVWHLDTDGLLRCGGPGSTLVLDYADGELRLTEAAGARASQQWDFVDGRLINRQHPGDALEVVPPFGREARLTLAPASSASAQQWTLVPVADPSTILEPGPWDGDVDD